MAGIPAGEVQQDLTTAHSLFDSGEYDDAIDAYEEILARVPRLTSLNLQIGHAYREKQDIERALEAYRAVPRDTPAAEEAALAIESLDAAAGR